jgi:hypothetical protein
MQTLTQDLRYGCHILSVLDRCCDAFTFPMLDNGYVYLAAKRLDRYSCEAREKWRTEEGGLTIRSSGPLLAAAELNRLR